MACRNWWIMASISFLVSMILGALSFCFKGNVAGLYLALVACGFVVSGWVLWAIGLVSYLRWR